MRVIAPGLLFLLSLTGWASAQESYKVEQVKQAPPAVAAAIKQLLSDRMFRISDGRGKVLAEIWPRVTVPGSSKPAGPKGTILYPFLSDGELMGVCQFVREGHDYRDQAIPKGLYTMRYGLQPVNGDHLGVSTHRDYVLLLPAAKDQAVDRPSRKRLEQGSAEAAGSSHPAVFLLLAAPEGASSQETTMIEDTEKNTWSVVFPYMIEVKGSSPVALPIRMVIVGAAPA